MASDHGDRLPPLLLLPGRHPAMIDSGFVGHADQTAERASAQLGQVELVVNTHWHSDHRIRNEGHAESGVYNLEYVDGTASLHSPPPERSKTR